MNIVFMGTPDFSVPCLKMLYKAGHKISAVFTQPDKAVGRKQVLTPSAVKLEALKMGLPIYQPKTLRDGEPEKIIRSFHTDLIVVVAYGKILPPTILSSTKYGCVNVHASLLPKFRGASPIQSAILEGETVTGVTTMQMDEGVDTGDILMQAELTIQPQDTAETLFEKLSTLGAELLLKTVEGLQSHTLIPRPQLEKDATYCTILTRERGQIDYRSPAQMVLNLIRGLYPWPAAHFEMNGKRYKILSAAFAGKTEALPGTLLMNQKGLCLACGDGNAVLILEIQPEGKKRMSAQDFMNGWKQTGGLKLDSRSEASCS